MYGAIIGDIVGSKYEFQNIRQKSFPLFSPGCDVTDDSLMTIAVARALVQSDREGISFPKTLVAQMQAMGARYPYPQGGYGGRFGWWLRQPDPQPYNSFGNGSAMRVSACGLFAVTLEEALSLADISAQVTHNHPEGRKGAKAVAAAIFLARSGRSKSDIRQYVTEHFYPLNRTVSQIREDYSFNESCQGTVPEAILCFLESEHFEDAIRNAISIGGDSDTVGAITGSIAWSYYVAQNQGIPTGEMDAIRKVAHGYLPKELASYPAEFADLCRIRMAHYVQTGTVRSIPE